MRIGNLSQTVWKRDIQRQIQTRRAESVFPLSIEARCSAISDGDGACPTFVWSEASVSGDSDVIGKYALLQAANDLACRGAQPIGVSVEMLLPLRAEETEAAAVVTQMERLCERLHMQITRVRAEGNPSVSKKMVHVPAAGILRAGGEEKTAGEGKLTEKERDTGKESKKVLPGQELILCGCAGLEGTLLIEAESEEELGKRFPPSFLRQTRALEENLITPEVVLGALHNGAVRVCQIGSGGILAALWEMTEADKAGMEMDFSNILICQETVEICEHYQLNPYQMISAGSALMIADEGAALLDYLKRAGARAGRLGVITAGNARVITSGTEKRYLDRPAPDEYLRWLSERP